MNRDAAFAAGWQALRALPEPAVRAAFASGADLQWRRRTKSVRRLRSNLARVRPELGPAELDRLTRAGMRSYARYWFEVFRLPAFSPRRIVEGMTVVDEPRLRDGYSAGRGLILALPHMGNWDHAGAFLTHTGIPFTTVAERLQPEELYERFVRFREGLGMEVIPLTGGQRPPAELLADRLRAGGCLCLLADRDLTTSGVEVDFFGARAKMPAGPAALAWQTGATLLPVTLWYPDGRRWAARIHPQVEVPAGADRAAAVQAMTQQLADAFAEGIAAHPQDWHMLARLWVEDLQPRPAPAEVPG